MTWVRQVVAKDHPTTCSAGTARPVSGSGVAGSSSGTFYPRKVESAAKYHYFSPRKPPVTRRHRADQCA